MRNISAGPDDVDGLIAAVTDAVGAALTRKREDVAWKLASVRAAYDSLIEPLLHEARRSG